jgi:hypothetical protein
MMNPPLLTVPQIKSAVGAREWRSGPKPQQENLSSSTGNCGIEMTPALHQPTSYPLRRNHHHGHESQREK